MWPGPRYESSLHAALAADEHSPPRNGQAAVKWLCRSRERIRGWVRVHKRGLLQEQQASGRKSCGRFDLTPNLV